MTSVLEQKFEHKLLLDDRYRNEIEQYCQREIGYRTYYMRQYLGGKQWRMANRNSMESKVVVELNDSGHATILALKYAS